MAELNAATIKQGAMAVLGRLDEVRKRLVTTAIAIAAAAIVGWFLSPWILGRLSGLVPKVVYTTPAESFMAQVELALVIGVFLALPVVLWEIWAFFSPLIAARARRSAFWVVPATFVLFLGGSAFCFFFVIPAALRFFMSYASADLRPMIQFRALIKFAEGMIIPFGLIFELPVVAFFLTRIGLLKPGPLAANRKYAIFVCAIIAAVITPTPDPITMALMWFPLYFMYEVSIWISRLVPMGRQRRTEN